MFKKLILTIFIFTSILCVSSLTHRNRGYASSVKNADVQYASFYGLSDYEEIKHKEVLSQEEIGIDFWGMAEIN